MSQDKRIKPDAGRRERPVIKAAEPKRPDSRKRYSVCGFQSACT